MQVFPEREIMPGTQFRHFESRKLVFLANSVAIRHSCHSHHPTRSTLSIHLCRLLSTPSSLQSLKNPGISTTKIIEKRRFQEGDDMVQRIATTRQRGTGTAFGVPLPVFALFCLFLGFFLGSQLQVIKQLHNDPTPLSSSLENFVSSKQLPSNTTTAETKTKTDNRRDKSGAFQLHPTITIAEDPELYKELVNTKAKELVEHGKVDDCNQTLVEPYLQILRNIEKDPLFYEDGNTANDEACPLVFMFYFEGGSFIADTFFEYYSNIKTKRCINFIVSRKWMAIPETREMAESKGYKILEKHMPKQDKCISQNLYVIQEKFGDDTLVSVNDLDHLLVWFDKNGTAHRYSSYTDMVRMYVVELLTTKGCSNQQVKEKYVAPCTCLMEDNQKYVSRHEDGVIWSEYGVTNRFHPTGNFYLDRKFHRKDDGSESYVYSISTVFANLRKYEVSTLRF